MAEGRCQEIISSHRTS